MEHALEDTVTDGEDNGLEMDHVNIPGAPDDWIPPLPKTEAGEPPFEMVDNPGEWSQFTYRPQFGSSGRGRSGGRGRGVFTGGYRDSPTAKFIDYVTIPTTGNAINFGSLTNSIWGAGCCYLLLLPDAVASCR